MGETVEGIAIIGMACKFPGARNIEEFWNNLLHEKETIKHFSDEELTKKEFNINQLLKDPNYVKARGVLDDIDQWDANFFNVIPKDAKEIDPQQRLWLETTWEAFEDAGCDPFRYKGIAGVFAGSFLNTYLLNTILRDPIAYELYLRGRTPEIFQAYINSDPMFLASRTAYFYNLKGPALSIQTACSTSLVAVCQACNSLLSYESDLCVAGGSTVLVPQETGYLYQEGAIGSPDGHCRSFDINSKGTVFGNGVGVVILKRLQDALNDKDNIYAVIKGWAVNNDGNEKVGFTAPSIEGQAKVITEAQSFANINAEEIRYVEAHGTATPLGDPIEVAALTKAFRKTTSKTQYCGLGSVKSNIGHLDAAAGVAGLIKIALATYYRKVPATLHYTAPNPMLKIETSPFYIQNKLQIFGENESLKMGVSSFGIGGTNAHVIIGEAPSRFKEDLLKKNVYPSLIVLSAKTENSLHQRKQQLVEFLEKNPNVNLANLGYTLQEGRRHLEFRSCSIIDTSEKITDLSINSYEGKMEQILNSIAFAFPGQGAQYVGMGKQLYDSSQIFRSYVDKCFEIFSAVTGEDIKSIIFAEDNQKEAEIKLSQTKYTQSALFIIEYSLAKFYSYLGIEPSIMIGHSIGEYAAACVAGVFDLDSALKIVIKRGELMQGMPIGKMIAVNCSKDKLDEINSGLFEIAADNAQDGCTISFSEENTKSIEQLLDSNQIVHTLLNTSHAFHSKFFDPILEEFRDYVNQFEKRSPNIPFISSLTGELISDEEASSGEYWANQLRHTVHFRTGISFIVKKENTIFLEVGPNTHLSSLIRRNKNLNNKKLVITSLGKPKDIGDLKRIIQSIGELWVNGYNIHFENIRNNNENIQKISLPTYPWEKKRYWIDISSNSIPEYGKVINSELEIALTNQSSTIKSEDNTTKSIKLLLNNLSDIPLIELDEKIQFANFGFDSLFLAKFAREIERKYKIPILFKQLIQDFTTIKSLSEYITSITQNVELNKELLPSELAKEKRVLDNLALIQPNGSKNPFFLIFGEEGFSFKPSDFGTDRPFYTFVHLGADGEEITFSNTEQISELFLNQILKVKPKGPYLLGGFSFGGILAFDIATRLRKMGHEVDALVMIDCKNPLISEPPITLSQRLRFGRYKRKIQRKIFKHVNKLYFKFKWPIPVNRRQDYITMTYIRLLEKYKPTSFDGDALLIKASENNSIHEFLGWENYINNITLKTFTGNHHNVLRQENNIPFISKLVKEYIEQNEKSKLQNNI